MLAGPISDAMTGLTRYVLKQLVVGMILFTIGLTCVMWLSQSLRFIELIVNRGLTAGTFLYLTMLLLPNFLTIILPIALFIVIAFTYSKMIGDRELVVMRAAGLSQWSLAAPVLILAAITIGLLYWLNLRLLPETYRNFKELQWTIRHSYSHVLLREGAFNNIQPGITIYIRERTPDSQLLGILVHDERRKDRPSTLMAARGALVNTDEGARVIMFDGNRQEVDPETRQLSILYFDRYVFQIDPSEGALDIRYREPRERTLMELFSVASDPYVDKREHGRFIVEGHKRLTQPILALGLALIALACLISGSVTRRGQTRRVAVAVGLMVIVQAVVMGIENLAAKNLLLVPMMYAIAIAVPITAFAIMVGQPGRRRSARLRPA